MRYTLAFLLLAFCAAASTTSAELQLFAMSVTQQRLMTVDLQTAALTPVGSVGTYIQDITWDPLEGSLYGYDFQTDQRLLRIDPATAAIQPVGDPLPTYGWEHVHGMAYRPDSDQLYATLQLSRDLLRIEPATGVPELVGTMAENCWSLTYDPARECLWGVTLQHTLVRIDPATAVQTRVGAEGGIGAPVEGLELHPTDGFLYAVLIRSPVEDSSLARIDPLNGQVTEIAAIGSDDFVSGLAFAPEPTGAVTFLLAGCLLLRRRG